MEMSQDRAACENQDLIFPTELSRAISRHLGCAVFVVIGYFLRRELKLFKYGPAARRLRRRGELGPTPGIFASAFGRVGHTR